MPRGGVRPGAGRRRGSKSRTTLTKEAMREHVRQRVSAELDPLLDAQIANAKGIEYLVARDPKSGKFTPVEDKGRIADATEIWLKQPNVQAFTDLLNRALDKPKEQEQEIKLTGDDALIAALLNGRKRAKEARI